MRVILSVIKADIKAGRLRSGLLARGMQLGHDLLTIGGKTVGGCHE
jgi:hypothetical protein